MRTLATLTLTAAVSALGACSNPECGDDELKVGKTCIAQHSHDAGVGTNSDAGARIDLSDTGIEPRSDGAMVQSDTGASANANSAEDASTVASDDAGINPDDASTDGHDAAAMGSCSGGPLNDCGGCEALTHSIGEQCSNGGVGACAQGGFYHCVGASLVCSAPGPNPVPEVCDGVDNDCDNMIDEDLPLNACGKCGPLPAEVCGDDIDNDCNGSKDDPASVDAKMWYPDCDGDGFATDVGPVKACSAPASTDTCKAWLGTAPSAGTWDCRDDSTGYHPGAMGGSALAGTTAWGAPSGPVRFDFNCNGKVEIAPVALCGNQLCPWCPNSTGCPSGVGKVCMPGDPAMLSPDTNCGQAGTFMLHLVATNNVCTTTSENASAILCQ